MDGLAELLLTVAWAIGPNGQAVHAQLDDPALRQTVPVAALADTTPDLWVVYHEVDGWPMAFFTPAGTSRPALPALGPVEAAAPRLLPGLAVPRLYLYRDYYRAPASATPAPVGAMPLDVAEYYFHALLDAWLDPTSGRAGGGFREDLARRSEVLMASVPADQRQDAYRAALADFGAHLLSTALEIRRSLERRRRAGKDPCGALDRPGTLYALWPRIFDESPFPGLYRAPTGEWTRTVAILERADKERLAAEVLDIPWTGDLRRDLGLACP